MEAAMAKLELDSLKLSGGKEEETASQTTEEQTAEAKAKDPEGEKPPVMETTEAEKARKMEILARAAEKVAKAQISMVLKSAKAEVMVAPLFMVYGAVSIPGMDT